MSLWNRKGMVVSLPMVFALFAAGCSGAGAPTTAPTAPPAAVAPTPAPTAEPMYQNSVSVSDQAISDEGTVVIEKVVSQTPGWLVVHADADGSPGPVIGHAEIERGENTDIEVSVEPARLTDQLYAMLHVDAGSPGEYEFPGDDAPARNDDGAVVVRPFAAYRNAVQVSDQELAAGDTVVIDRVVSRTPGWLVVHAEADGAPGPVIGHSSVDLGENMNVEVSLDPMMLTSTLFAMLHVDEGGAGEYEFPGDDAPARDSHGDVAVTPFTLTANAVSVKDQSLGEGSMVRIDRVLSKAPGWLVVHADDGGKPGMILGHAAVDAGETSDLEVELSPEGITGTLYAMLHVDEGTPGEFEFPGGADLPAEDSNGDIVTPSFMISDEAASPSSEEVVIEVGDNRFAPKEITVKAGATVLWTHQGSLGHTVTADDGSFDSGQMKGGSTFRYTFDEPGTYAYHCAFHGAEGAVGMAGVVTVTE
jgi:plastocyanin